MRNALLTPWKAWNELFRYVSHPVVRILFLFNNIAWNAHWKFYGIPMIQKHRLSNMTIGEGLTLRSSLLSNPLGPTHPVILCTWQEDAIIQIGNNFSMTGGTICAAKGIMIGDRVAVGANCTIVDTDFHPVDYQERLQKPASGISLPVFIGNDVFIGMNSIVLKGVQLGNTCVIGAGSVVTKSIPPGVIAAGNPAQVIRAI